jgi:hypothetical protein
VDEVLLLGGEPAQLPALFVEDVTEAAAPARNVAGRDVEQSLREDVRPG